MVGQAVSLTSSEQTVAAAAAAFLAQPSLARSTRRSYEQTLTRLVHELGGDRRLSTLTVEAVRVAGTTAWGGRAPATWNRQVATVRSFLGFCRRRRAVGRLRPSLQADGEILDEPMAPLPDRLGPAAAAADRRAHPWTPLPGRPAPGPSASASDGRSLPGDRPGSAELPARRGTVPGGSSGWTLHQLRHSALTHLAEQNVSLPLVLAKSHHASLRSLQRYARPGAEAVAAMTAATDPARRRNHGRLE
jgi:hypothetical protein